MRGIAVALCGAIILAACAKSPESISPAYVSLLAYDDLDCGQLVQEEANVSRALLSASEQQRDARTNDTVGVILLGLPVSTLSGGNVADQIASLKGQQVALQQVMVRKRCTVAAASGGESSAGGPSDSAPSDVTDTKEQWPS